MVTERMNLGALVVLLVILLLVSAFGMVALSFVHAMLGL